MTQMTQDYAIKRYGFTLLELLVVIAIIGILAQIVLSSLQTARLKGQTAKAMAELRNVRSAIALLEDDTGKWPNGCPVSQVVAQGDEVSFAAANAGVVAPPTAGGTAPCIWTASDIAKWKGPYMPGALDPWGNPYWFDGDYYPRRDCPTPNANPSVTPIIAVESHGPDGVGGAENAVYDCDDIYIQIQ